MKPILPRLFPLAIASFVLLAPLRAPATSGDDHDAYRQSIDEWHAGRVERLTRDGGWLYIVGLYPITDGVHSFGSAPDNDVVFPAGAPAHAGRFYREDGVVKLAVEPGVRILSEGAEIMATDLRPDTEDSTTVLEMGSFEFYCIQREGNHYIRLIDYDSPARKRFSGIERYPVDPRWRIEARFEPYDPPRTIRVPNVLGYDFVVQCPGVIVFDVDGTECRLEPVEREGDEMMVVFGDATSGSETYGGGRFVYVHVPDEDGHIVIDFNRAYNPPCAFTDYATCPLPHQANILRVPIHAGEKAYHEGTH